MKKRLSFKRSTCYAIGVAGGVVGIIGGGLMAAGFGKAQYTHTAVLVLLGAMLLLLAIQEKGPENRTKRTQYLLLVFALIIGNLRLPPLDLFEVLVLPLALLMNRQKGDGPYIAVLAVFEAAYAVVRYLDWMNRLGPDSLRVVGVVWIALSLVRGLVLLRERNWAAARQRQSGDDAAVRRLK